MSLYINYWLYEPNFCIVNREDLGLYNYAKITFIHPVMNVQWHDIFDSLFLNTLYVELRSKSAFITVKYTSFKIQHTHNKIEGKQSNSAAFPLAFISLTDNKLFIEEAKKRKPFLKYKKKNGSRKLKSNSMAYEKYEFRKNEK